MIISFFESIKYMGHMWPAALLRIYVGYLFLNAGIDKLKQNYLQQPILTEIVQKWVEAGDAGSKYVHFLKDWVLPHWQTFSYLVVFGEVAVGFCFIVGFMVRPAAIVAIFMNLNFLMAAGPMAAAINKTLIAVNLTLYLLSAGRCVGFDYYFYKRIRGIWW